MSQRAKFHIQTTTVNADEYVVLYERKETRSKIVHSVMKGEKRGWKGTLSAFKIFF